MKTYALLWLALSIILCRPEAPTRFEGVYAIEASLGEVTVQGTLELLRVDGELRGRLTLMLGQPMYLAIQPDAPLAGASASFTVSSPGTGLRLAFDGDAVSGTLTLSGNREVSITGSRAASASVSEDLSTHFALAPFEPGHLSMKQTGEVFPTFTPDGRTLYFGRYERDFAYQTVMVSHYLDGRWTAPVAAPFSGTYRDRSPFVTPDGERLLLASMRPLPGDTAAQQVYNLWYMDLTASGAARALQPLAAVNSPANDYQPSVARDGTLYFTSQREGGLGGQDLYRSRRVDGAYTTPENLGKAVNSEQSEMSGYVSPDGEMLILSSAQPHTGHLGNDDLYVSFREEDGWSAPRNLGLGVNSFANEYGAAFSPDGRYLYFVSDRRPPADLYRVEVQSLPALSGR